MWVKNKSELEGALKKIRLDLSNVLDHSKHGAIVEIKKHRPNRSQAQHNFYMVIVTSISKFYMEAGALYIIKGFKLEYDKKYESNPVRVKYREDLNRERRKRHIYGQGGPDMSHTSQHTIVPEDPHTNRARHFKSKGTLL